MASPGSQIDARIRIVRGMMSDAPILLNRIRTPDGTVLTSYHRHDYRTHKDANGETYMVDGGTAYLRRNHCKEPYEELTVVLTDDHEVNRKAFHWGSRGPMGDQPVQYRPLCELSDDHIQAILETQPQIEGTYIEGLLAAELKYRHVPRETK